MGEGMGVEGWGGVDGWPLDRRDTAKIGFKQVSTTLQPLVNHTTWHPFGKHFVTSWKPRGTYLATTWQRCGIRLATTWPTIW